jgi:hypothetical protein
VVVLLNERPHLQPATDELLGEEGVAFALGMQELTDERTDRATQIARRKGLDLFGGERIDRHGAEHTPADKLGHRPFKCRVPVDLAFPVAAQNQQPGFGMMARNVTKQVKAGSVGPMEVIEHEDEPMWSTNAFQEGPNSFIETQTCLLRRQRISNGKLAV